MEKQIFDFLIQARTNTYAGDSGKVKPALSESTQLEYKQSNFLYRDIYYTGKNNFAGLEVIYFKNKPVWIMNYYGNWMDMTEKEIDQILKKALIEKVHETRLNKKVHLKQEDYKYICLGKGNLKEFQGSEVIFKKAKKIYWLEYNGGVLTEKINAGL